MLQKQLETHGMVYVPTCIVGPRLVWHSSVPDLLGPGLAHHRIEPGLAFLRASLEHLRVGLGPGLDHHGLDPGIYWQLQLGVRRGLYQKSSLTSKAFNVVGVIAILRPVEVFVGIKFKTHFVKSLHGN
jgi:hypothetical protein